MKICIDAGHGGKDPGACGNGLKEKDITLNIAKSVSEILKKQGFEVYQTRTSDIYDSPDEKAQKGNSYNADLFVSIHCNSAVDTTATGTEVLIYGYDSTNEVIANHILNNLVELGLRNRGIKTRPDLAILRETKMSAVIAETAFISNINDSKLLLDYNKFAEAIAKGICRYYGVVYREKDEEKEVEVRYNNIEEVPSWGKSAVQKLIDAGKFADVNKLDLSYDMVRMMFIMG